MTDPAIHHPPAELVERLERRWATVSVVIIALLVVLAAFAGIRQATMPQFAMETVDPRTLHISGEFIESNLGSALEPDGSVTVRAVGQQYSFTPQCIVVPAGRPVTFRATSSDVVHGFLIDGTDVNTMLVPGFVSTIITRFNEPGERHMPCHEYCGVGHEGMWGEIRVVDLPTFLRMTSAQKRVSCVK